MTSPHWTIAKALETVLTTWAAANWSGAEVVAAFQLERFNEIVTGTDGSVVIGLLPTSVVNDSDGAARRHDQDVITISAIVVSRLADFKTSTIEAVDTKTDLLRKYLQTVQTVAVGSEQAERQSTQLFTVFDHDKLSDEVFASLILCEYEFDAGELGEVAA